MTRREAERKFKTVRSKEAPRSVHFFLVQTHKKTDRLMKQVVIYLAAIALLIARYVRTTERGDIISISIIIIIIIAH